MSISVADLRERPEFASSVADRVWRAWWKSNGYELAYIEEHVRETLNSDAMPVALVAHDGGTFLGTAGLIASDLDGRPHLTPWVAAVWVDPAHRSSGVGAALVRAGAEKAADLGFDSAYLTALPPAHGFYRRLGWSVVEADVGEERIAVFRSP